MKHRATKLEGEIPVVYTYTMHQTDLPLFWKSYRMHQLRFRVADNYIIAD